MIDALQMIGLVTIGIIAVFGGFAMLAIIIEEFYYSKTKVWRLIWRKFRRWLST